MISETYPQIVQKNNIKIITSVCVCVRERKNKAKVIKY